MTRIVAGRFGGRRLAVPPSGTRPTSDMAREGVFSTLTSLLGDLDGVRFLDLYAGSGAMGLEALSRGAAAVVFVESGARALTALRSNVAAVLDADREPAVLVVAAKVETAVRDLAARTFDVVFADPPYELASQALAEVIAAVRERGLLADGAVVVVERASRDAWSWPDGIEQVRERRYGDATLWYGRAARPAGVEEES